MKQFLTIFKKELRMFFSNRRLLISSLIPGFIIMLFYIIAGNISDGQKDYSKSDFKVCEINRVDDYEDLFLDYKITYDYYDSEDAAKDALLNGNLDLIIVYEEEFSKKITEGEIPNVDLYYNSKDDKSVYIYTCINSILFNNGTNVIFTYTLNENSTSDLSDGQGQAIRIMSMLIPYLLISVIFAGCVNATSTVIAGEKERGTMATLLVTPVNRSIICFGKMLALAVIALFTSTASLCFTLIATKFTKDSSLAIDFSLYNATTIMEIIAILLVSVIFFTVVLCCISTYAKTVKEANSLSTALNLIILLLAMTSITGFSPSNDFYFIIPFYNSILSLQQLLKMTYTAKEFLMTIVTIILYSAIGIFICKKMFESEKVMFSKK